MRSRAIEAYKTRLELSATHREVLIGLLLGDGCLETQNDGRTYRLKIEQSARHEAYVKHLYSLFREWVLSPPRAKSVRASNGRRTTNIAFQTVSHEALRDYGRQFYGGRRKRVPELIADWLTPRGLAYWFMDDGSVKSAQSKGVIFNTHAFDLEEIARLVDALQDLGLAASVRRQPDGNQIYVSGRSYSTFRNLIDPYVLDEMRYKVPLARRTPLPKR